MRLRTKIIEEEACQFTGDNVDAMKDFLGANFVREEGNNIVINNKKSDGSFEEQVCHPTDWAIQDPEGAHYPCPDSIRNAKYETETATAAS